MDDFQSDVAGALSYLSELEGKEKFYDSQLYAAQENMKSLLEQQELIEQAKVALEQAKPLLSATSIKQLEKLANTAISTIFNMNAVIEYDVESKRFVIKDENGVADLVDANGGGLCTVISFVFDLFLLVKAGCRRFLTYDEAFYAVSDQYFNAFIDFMVKACHDLDIDLLCISHDARLTTDMVDTAYYMENGKTTKVK